jgi:hypothetical protein
MKYALAILAVFIAFLIPELHYDEKFPITLPAVQPILEPYKDTLVQLGLLDVVEVKTAVIAPETVTAPISDNWYRDFIFQHESGGRLDAVNSIGCYGLGQDCNNVLESQCPDWRTNLTCQVDFWDKYAIRRYGSWEAAYNFWEVQGHRWW